MRIYLSGWQASRRERELVVIKGGGMKHRCFSFAMIQKLNGLPYYLAHLTGSYEACLENGIGIMMDSGVVSWRSYRATCQKQGNQKALDKLLGEDEFIGQYVKYVKENQKHWDFYMTIDLERNAPSILERHKRIEAMGIRPVPVFHGDSSADFVKKYADMGHKLVALASWRTIRTGKKQFQQYFDACFNVGAKCGVQFHGLAMTAPWMMLDFPWFSVDSSSWSRVAGFGKLMYFDEQKHRMSVLHVSERHAEGKGSEIRLNTRSMKMIREAIEAEGFDFDTMRGDDGFVQRHLWNGRTMVRMAEVAEARHQGKANWRLLF